MHGVQSMNLNIQIFMNTANSSYERDLLRDMHRGINQKLNPNNLPYLEWIESTNNDLSFNYIDKYKMPKDVDLAVMLGSWKPQRIKDWNNPGHNLHHYIRTLIARESRNFLCIETPLLNRQISNDHEYYRVGLNGFLANDGIFIEPRKYPKDRLDELGIEFPGWKTKGDKIIIALQLPGDASMRNQDVNDWCLACVQQIRKLSNRPIDIRTHPGLGEKSWSYVTDLFRQLQKLNLQDVKLVDGSVVNLQDHFQDAYCLIGYTSGVCIDAVVNGIPVIAHDEGNFTYDICEKYIDNIENIYDSLPSVEATQQHLQNLAYHQWSREEMQTGQVWEHFAKILEKNLVK